MYHNTKKENITLNLTLIHNTFSAFNKFLGVKYAFVTLQHIYLYILLMGYFIAVCVADTHRVKGEFTQNKIKSAIIYPRPHLIPNPCAVIFHVENKTHHSELLNDFRRLVHTSYGLYFFFWCCFCIVWAFLQLDSLWSCC